MYSPLHRTTWGSFPQTRSGPFQNQPIINTMLAYYGKHGIKEYLPMDSPSLTEKNPIGALTLVCTTVQTPEPLFMCPITNSTLLQVERAFLMHSTGYFIKDERAFSEKWWGHRTTIYIKLVKELSNSRWNGINGALASAKDLLDKLKKASQPVVRWTNDPEEYFIVGSDPAEPE